MEIIKDTNRLEEACLELARSPFVAVDTEFMRETTFWADLCLIQMASPELEVIVDPLADGIDLAPFFALMADTSVVKVFHAARQDVEIIYHMGRVIPEPLFDTQVAASVCGYGDQISYDQLVSRTLNESIDKSSRFTDWSRRPLSEQQLEYALADVTHLRDVYTQLHDRLERENRLHWLDEEMRILTRIETYDLPPEDAWTRMKLRARKPLELAITQRLAEWRESEARRRNQPRGRIIKDDAVYEIAAQAPKSAEALSRLRSLSRGFERSQSAQDILRIVAETLELPREDLPAVPRKAQPPEGAGAAVELLKVLLKLVADEENVASRMIASSSDLEQIAARREEADVNALSGWRRTLFGDQALSLIQGDLALTFDGKKVVSRAL